MNKFIEVSINKVVSGLKSSDVLNEIIYEMRTTQLKIGNEKREAILVAGGPGFKIYSAYGIPGWVVVIGKKVYIVDEKHAEFKTVGRYLTLKYQPQDQKQAIQDAFDLFVKSKR